jgi:threonine/homoserine/homoserine lactone efflux protein
LSFGLFFQSLLIGFAIAAPVGPIGILCIQRTISHGRLAGFISGLGAATADAVYGAIAAFGITLVSVFLIDQAYWLRLGGGIILILIGIKTFLATPLELNPGENSENKSIGLLGNYFSTFILTLSNPLTIISFTAIFAGFGAESLQNRNYIEASLMVLGIFLGSVIWWFSLSYLASLLRSRVNTSIMRWINRVAGITIFGFGVAVLLSIVSG